jgi:hypothetical protein
MYLRFRVALGSLATHEQFASRTTQRIYRKVILYA